MRIPPNCSLVSAYGPSVTLTLPFFHRKVLASEGSGRFHRKVTVLSQHVVVGEALVHHGIPLAVRHRPTLPYVSKADVFHRFLLFLFIMNFPFTSYSRLTKPKIDNANR
jgi:hypothetical protein